MKMTESMKSEVVRLYFEENREEAEIAARLGISLRQAKTVLGDLARLETYKKRSEAAKLRAQICVNKSAEEAARRQAALLLDGEVNETISQRAAKDILDRAGVRVPKESRSDVVIRFAQGAPPLGMPVKQAFCRDSSLAASSLVIYTIRSYRSSTWASCPASLAAKKSDSVVSVYWLFSTVFIIQLNSSTRISAIISGVK